ncbi:MAG: PTS sugar transporter subunit IIC, partial [Bacteroidales bacterium]
MRVFLKRYFVDAPGAMALGLFSSLIIGVILTQLAKIPYFEFAGVIADVLSAKSPVIGSAIGVAIAFSLKSAPLVIFSSAASG